MGKTSQKVMYDTPLIRVWEIYDPDDVNIMKGMLFVETLYNKRDSMGPYRYHIQLNYEFHSMKGCVMSGYFEGGYLDKHVDGHQITLTGGSIILNAPRGLGIGSLLFCEVAKWAKTYSGIDIKTIFLSAFDAKDENNRKRRNRLYERFGIHMVYDEGEKSGFSLPMKTDDLIINENFLIDQGGNIRILRV
ncbi:hypothetical protein ACN4GA_24110 [Raoultella terrigena]|uniref:hypothetical protein n=1 Tax=Klebsiella grimontii TaxID=2058152 RepID=UPI0015E9B375|nr:hypothetical protein [Klebsiella grimontii]MBE8895347.1 hypothetical protein [Klebsiella grimontii]QLT87587.1 hypothetical protein HV252_09620 [Klebsiella grimontii]QQQ20266.1 hypothetical protein JIZ39_15385 [Klebsiella grimontii]